MKRIGLLMLIALAWPAGAETDAFVPLRTSSGEDEVWDLSREQPNVVGGRVTYYLDPAGTEDLSPSAALAAVRAGLKAWADVPHTAIDFVEDTTRPAAGRKSGDRVNLIQWVSGELGPFTFATTWPTYRDGFLTDSDILVNDDVRLTSTIALLWSTKNPGGSRTADIQGVITHEWGHAIGLDHEAIEGATMFPSAAAGSVYFRTLHPDDVAAVTTLYPAASAARELGTIRGRADVADRTNDRGVHVLAVDARSGEVVVGALSEPDGSYALRSLPPGDYYLIAAPFVSLGSLNGFWSTSATSFLPAVLTGSGTNGDYARILRVRAGETLTGADFQLLKVKDPAEPNDGPDSAVPLLLGDAIAARIEDGEEEDWYVFAGTKGQTISARVHSTQIGGFVDPSLQLLDQGAARVLRTATDIRNPLFYDNRIEGADVDARIEGFTLPATGTYYLRVREEAFTGPGDLEHYYVLVLAQDPDAPSPARSEFGVSPGAIHADGVSTARLTALPRDVFGDPVGPGVEIVFSPTGGGRVGPVTYDGSGVYSATLTAPLGGPSDSIDVTMKSGGATVGVPGAIRLRYIGVADPARSDLFASPRRIPADGVSTALVVLEPRDATGYPLGAGREVSFDLALPSPAGVAAAVDRGDGSYATTVTAPGENGSVTLSAAVDGVAAGDVTVYFGFDLLEVVRAIRAETKALSGDEATPGKAAKRLGKAAEQLAAAQSELEADPSARDAALKRVAKAAKQIEKAAKKLAEPSVLLPALTELSAAAREVAAGAIDRAEPVGGKELRLLEAAETRLASGDEAVGAGKYARAIKRYRSAARKATL